MIIASPKQAVVRALDPDKNGATIWGQDIARGIGGGAGETVFGGAVDQNTIYFGLYLGNGLVAMDLATGVEKWFRPLKNPEPMATHRGIVAAVSVIAVCSLPVEWTAFCARSLRWMEVRFGNSIPCRSSRR